MKQENQNFNLAKTRWARPFKEEEKIFANAFNMSPQIGAATLGKIKNRFGGIKKAWSAPISEISKLSKFKQLAEFRDKIDPHKEFEILKKEGVNVLLKKEFPQNLKEIEDSPEIIYTKGSLPDLSDKICLAVVGPRKYSDYGRQACENIISGLRGYNIVVISGLAAGIDTFAHKAALENNLKTIAVLGNGLHDSVLFPPRNLSLSKEITEKGSCIISEFPLKARANKFSFPQRNRIVAGLSHGTLVIEAPEKSGSLITSSLALDYNREVFAVPGNIFSPNAAGVNALIKEGAVPATTADDILNAFDIKKDIPAQKSNFDLTENEKNVISLLSEPLTRDELIRKSAMPAQEINPHLIEMEIKGIIKEVEGKLYKIC